MIYTYYTFNYNNIFTINFDYENFLKKLIIFKYYEPKKF